MSELLVKLLGLSKERLFVDPKHLSTLHRCGKLQELLVTAEASEASEASEMKVVLSQSGKYVGLGNQIIAERRQSQR